MHIPKTKKTIVGAAIASAALLVGGLTVANAAIAGDGPTITGTIKAPPDANGPETPQSEQAEIDRLTSLATLTPEQAKAAAEKVVGGAATSAEIDEEDGFVVYEVDVTTSASQLEVTVDAGSGAILAQEVDDDGPTIVGTIPAPLESDGPDTPQADQAETAQLQALATVTSERASAAAEKATGGTVTRTQIDEQDGFVVYDVDVTTPMGQVEVTVDAGSGKVLAQETDDESGETADEPDSSGTTDGQTEDGTVTTPAS